MQMLLGKYINITSKFKSRKNSNKTALTHIIFQFTFTRPLGMLGGEKHTFPKKLSSSIELKILMINLAQQLTF